MATWEDGPEYAPLQRPTDFGVPDVAPLETAEPYVQVAADAPKDRPRFNDPQDPVVPLQSLVPAAADEQRDPHTPFPTVESSMTTQAPRTSPTEPLGSGPGPGYGQVATIDGGSPGDHQITGGAGQSAWGAAHWSPPTGPPAGGGQWGPPQQAPPPGGFPSHGTPQWFGPGSQPGPMQRQTGPVDAKTVVESITPGVAITLVVGGLIYFLSPILIGVAFVLTSRIQIAQKMVRRAFFIGFGALGFFALVGLFTNNLSFGDWWGFVGTWALVICWGLLVASAALIYRALQSGARPQQPYPPQRQNWG